MKLLLLLLFIPTILISQDKVRSIDYTINMTVSNDTIFINTLIKGEFKEDLLLLNSSSNIRGFKINENDSKYTFKNDTLRYVYNNNTVNTISLDYFFIKNDYFLDSVIILKNEGIWFPRSSNSVFNYKIDIKYDNNKYFLITANNNNIYSDFNKSTISVFFLQKDTYKIFNVKNNEVEYNYYSVKDVEIDSIFINEFVYSSNYFIDFFNKKPYNTLNILHISSDRFNICQSLNQCIILGDIFYDQYKVSPKVSWVPHEVCHQWWGQDILFNNNSINYRFMEESITEYLKLTYINSKCGSEIYNYVIYSLKNHCNNYLNDSNIVSISSVENLNNVVNAVIIYYKGALLLTDMNLNYDINSLIKDIFKQYNNTMIDYSYIENSIKSFDKTCLLQLNYLLYSKNNFKYPISKK